MDDFHCSFCGRTRRSVPKLVCGPRVFICFDCVVGCRDLIVGSEEDVAGSVHLRPLGATIPSGFPDAYDNASRDAKSCSFCGKRQEETRVLVYGYVARVCDACVDLCLDICASEGLIPRPSTP
jgi:ATP-dependent protease Clp ATPase subunit